MDQTQVMGLNDQGALPDELSQDERSSAAEKESDAAQDASTAIPEASEHAAAEPLEGESAKPQPESEHLPRGNSYQEQFQKFLSDLEKIADMDAKLQFVLDFMTASLSQKGVPHFKTFWEARALCLNLFKEPISPALRSTLWLKYEELSKEARRLKEILDEQSSFAVEQFEIAIAALEEEVKGGEEHLKKMPAITIDISERVLSKGGNFYAELQRQLNLLNAHASRVNALRKELIRTEMRVRQKNRFFQRLSAAGDQIFPKRKELIKEISQAFNADVDAYIAAHFADEEMTHEEMAHERMHVSIFALREEIKQLQALAKMLTLNTHAFNSTRMQLSECWDKIKGVEKERKKERLQKKAVYKQNAEEGLKLIQEFNAAYAANQFVSSEEALKQLEEVVSHLRKLELGREEEALLKNEVQCARKLIKEKLHAEEVQREQEQQERERQRRQQLAELKQQLEELRKNAEMVDADGLAAQRDLLVQQVEQLQINKSERQELDRCLKPLRDLISEKRENSMLILSEDDRQALQQLKEVLKQKRERRQEIKEQMALFRKAGGVSGLDFEQALQANEQVATEKERLEKIDQSIEELQHKLAALQRKL